MHVIDVNWQAEGDYLGPYWRKCVGAGRVGEALRAVFQRHLELVQREMPFEYIRAHGLFHEDMMVYREEAGQSVFNWQYVDMVYDHWLSVGLRPFVELSFMPYDLASGDKTVFWWKGNVTPPKDWSKWGELVRRFVVHVIERYGIDEVLQWYFEVWNEPDLKGFWLNRDFEAYMRLYEVSVRAIKSVDPRLRVGGPATSGTVDHPGQACWGKEFLAACSERRLPLDFFSTHPYPTFHPVDLEGKGYMRWDEENRLLKDLDGFSRMLNETGHDHLERHYTEWNSSPSARDPIHDTAFLAPFVIRNNWLGRGHADSLSFWVVSDIFEENRFGDTPFHGGFGLINAQGLKKPSYHGYWFLSRLGDEVIQGSETHAVTRHKDGRISILLWNYCHYSDEGNDSRKFREAGSEGVYGLFREGKAETFRLRLPDCGKLTRIQTTRFDRDHGSVYDAWVAMGAPERLLPQDEEALHRKSELDVSVERIPAGACERTCHVPPHGVVLIEILHEPRL